MEVIDRYVHAVISKIPKNERSQAEETLRALIKEKQDKIDAKNEGKEDVEKLLQELGHPQEMATQLAKERAPFITGIRFDYYRLVLLTVGLTLTIHMLAIAIIEWFLLEKPFWLQALKLISELFLFGLPLVFAWTTILFFLIEALHRRRINRLNQEIWQPKNLPSLQTIKQETTQWKIVTALVLYVSLFVWLTLGKDYFGFWIFDKGEYIGTLSFMAEDFFQSTVLFILILLTLNIIKEIAKLVIGQWTNRLTGLITLVNSLSIIILFYFRDQLWNPQLIRSLISYDIIVRGTERYKMTILLWDQFTFWLVTLATLGLLMGIVTAFTKAANSSKD